MDIKNCEGLVVFSSSSAPTVKAAVQEAAKEKADLSGANLSGADLSGADLSGADLSDCINLSGADLSRADLSGANLSDANLSGVAINSKKVVSMRVFTGLYRYQVWAVVFEDGTRWVRMGCLFKSLEQWEEEGGVRKSNLYEFPNDSLDKCEERAAAFEFAKAAVLRMKETK